jgi:MoaA/NifB/PqqE/SkfB family radical SAM enzyme
MKCADNAIMLSKQELIKIKDYAKKELGGHVRFIGGEPTIHPNFKDILKMFACDKEIYSIHFFSNMTFGEDILELIKEISQEKTISILPNLNHPDIIGKDNYDKAVNNIKILSQINNVVGSIGINIFKPDQDTSYITELAYKLDIQNIRWNVVVPNVNKTGFNVKDYMLSFKPLLLEFFKDCSGKKLKPGQDCNTIPPCIFEPEELKEVIMNYPNLFSRTSCEPVIDLTPDLKVLRCFGMSEMMKIDFDTNKKPDEYENEFNRSLINYARKELFEGECKTCPIYKINGDRSCSCIAYKLVNTQ